MPAEKKSTDLIDEISKFTIHANSWWDPNGSFAPLHKINPPRLQFLLKHLCQHFQLDQSKPNPLEGLKIIDIGCGGGLLCEPLCRLGASVTGIDAGLENITIAKQHSESKDLSITYKQATPEELPSNTCFDAVISLEVIEHVKNLTSF